MKKRLVALVMASVLAGTMMAGCGSSSDTVAGSSDSSAEAASATDKTGKSTVRVLIPGLSEESTVDPVSGLETKSLAELQDFLNGQIPDYNIEVKTVAWDGWIQSTEAMVTSGEVDVGFYTNQEAIVDWYQDLTPYLEKDEELNLDNWEDIFVEPAVHYSIYKSFNHPDDTGKIYGLPETMACNLITYDSQLFEEWGVEEPTADMSFSELVDLAEQMTGTNPVTGKQNYGAYLYTSWTEWYSLCYDAVQPYTSDTMDINDSAVDELVESLNGNENVKSFYTDLCRLVKSSNPAIATQSGDENWMTEDNDIAINFDCNYHTKDYMAYVCAGDTSITDRYKYLLIPSGSNGSSFPEFFHFSIAQKASNGDDAWEVIKQLTTNKEIINFYLTNYATDKISCLKDCDGIQLMDYDINQERLAYQSEHMFITDDYWYWRTAMQTVDNNVLSGDYDADTASTELYSLVNDWVSNIRAQQ